VGYKAPASSLAEDGKFIGEDIEKWAKVIKFAGVKPNGGRSTRNSLFHVFRSAN
jgi:hypothetical protein